MSYCGAAGAALNKVRVKPLDVETTMRPLLAAAVIAALLAETFPASAAIRITASRYENGQLIIEGQTSPNAKVTLDGKYHTKADGGGRFKFRERYKPLTCMSSITAGEDSYSTIVTNCLLDDAAAAVTPAPGSPAATPPKVMPKTTR
jgi:hypothetical protein